jgi:hypothetical protein
MIRRLALLFALVLVLSACEIRSHLTIDAADLSNGTVTAEIGFDEEFREAMEQFGGEGMDLVAELEESAPDEGWTVEPFVDGDVEGAVLSHDFSSLTELQQLLESSMLASEDAASYDDISFTESDDTIRFEASLAAPDMEDQGMEGMDFDEISNFFQFDMKIAVTFPGDVIEHNGELTDNTVTWELDEEAFTGADLFAEARKAGGFDLSILLWIALGLIPVGVIVWAVRNRSRKDSPAQPEAAPVGIDPEPIAIDEPTHPLG